MVQQQTSGMGQFDAAAQTLEEAGLIVVFQFLDMLRHGRLLMNSSCAAFV